MIEPEYIIEISKKYEFLNFIKDFERLEFTTLILSFTLFVYISKNIYLFLVSWYQVNFLKNFINILTTKIFKNIINKKYLYFTNKNSSNFIKIIATDSLIIKNNLNYCAQIISEVFTILLISGLLFATHPYAVNHSNPFFNWNNNLFIFVKKKTRIWAEERNLFDRTRMGIVKQIISSIRDLKLLNIEDKFSDQFQKDNLSFLNVNRKHDLTLTLPKIWIELITIFTVLFLLFILIYLDDYQVLPKSIIPVLALYVGASFKLIPSFNKIITGVQSLRFVTPVLDEYKLLSIENIKDKEKFENSSKKITLNSKIKISNLKFSYDKINYVLDHLNLEIHKGAKIGILGKSGSGKSTFLDIFTGIIDEYDGKITVDGVDIRDGIRSWRNSISYLSQNSVFLNDSIKTTYYWEVKKQMKI